MFHPGYAIYENGVPSRLVLFNYVSDPSGASTYQAAVTFGDNSTLPGQVSVRYLVAPTVADHYNITWAGQDLGTMSTSDGTLRGEQKTDTITCTNGQCVIPVPAPSIALVFLTDEALTLSNPVEGATQTYATTVVGFGSATIDPNTLETSNGQNGNGLGSNSKGSAGAAGKRAALPVYGGTASSLVLGLAILLSGLI